MKKLIRCGQFFSGKDETVQENMAIIIDKNKIIEVCPYHQLPTFDGEIIDLSNQFVMPGLIDAHVHINMNGEADMMNLISHTTIGELTLLSMNHAQKDLMAGFTTLRDEGAYGFSDVSLKNAINAGLVIGPRLLVSGMSISSTGGHGDNHLTPYMTGGSFSTIVNSPSEARKAARYTFKYGADQIKLMATGGVISFGDEPGAPELSFEEMKAALDIANSRGKLSSAHAHGAEGIKLAIRAGITSIEHGMMIDEEGIDMLAEYGVYLIPTIIAAYRIVEFGSQSGIPAWAVEKASRCLENHGTNLKKMIKKGVKIGFGSDAATPYNKHGEQGFEFELMTRYGFTPVQTLLCATKVNSELLKMNDKIGSIEVGKLADIVAFDKSPLLDIKAMTDCRFVMKDGVVYKH